MAKARRGKGRPTCDPAPNPEPVEQLPAPGSPEMRALIRRTVEVEAAAGNIQAVKILRLGLGLLEETGADGHAPSALSDLARAALWHADRAARGFDFSAPQAVECPHCRGTVRAVIDTGFRISFIGPHDFGGGG
jgi:hypothetical protein